jgi:aspartate-semialdehyde dehydrogenase
MIEATRPPSSTGTARVAVVGAATPDGGRLREMLARRGVQSSRVRLYGTSPGDAVLSEYGGEARLIQKPDVDEIARHDIVFLCETSEAADRIVKVAGRTATVIDLTHRNADREGTRLVRVGIAPEAAPGSILVTPHPIAVMLAEILHPLQRAFGLREVVATVLRPAADYGDEGIEELREQTVRLLRFEKAPKAVFGQQLAFNLIPQSLLARREEGLERRIAGEVATLVGWKEDRLATRLVMAPVFLGHALSLRVETERKVDATVVTATIGRSRARSLAGRKSAGTPLAAPEERRTEVGEIVEDGMGGFWIWAIAGEAGTTTAEQAVLAAAAVSDL